VHFVGMEHQRYLGTLDAWPGFFQRLAADEFVVEGNRSAVAELVRADIVVFDIFRPEGAVQRFLAFKGI